MKYLFLRYKLAQLAKEKGFKDQCFGIYDRKRIFHTAGGVYKFVEGEDNILAPLHQQMIDWLREEYNLHISINIGFGYPIWWAYTILNTNNSDDSIDSGNGIETPASWDTYYEALSNAIEKALTLII